MYENIQHDNKPLIKAILETVRSQRIHNESQFGISHRVSPEQYHATKTSLLFVVEQLKVLGFISCEDELMTLTFSGEDLYHKLSA